MNKFEELLLPKQFKWVLERKLAIEHHYGSWYEEPVYDPFKPQFDGDKHRAMLRSIMEEFMDNSFGGYALAWKDVGAEVPYEETHGHETVGTRAAQPVQRVKSAATCQKNENQSKVILSGVSGYMKPGEIALIQAPPGAGTTTLLNILSGATDIYPETQGQVLYNDENILDHDIGKLYRHTVMRVRQEDVHFPQLTVRETLAFAAEAGVPDFLPYASVIRKHRIEVITRILGINHTLDTPVGDEGLRGVSGGERKRVTIAEIICGSFGSVVFLDNISKGLDAATTLDICKSLKDVAREMDFTIFASLQQLGNEAFHLFDKVCLLDSGRCIFFGPIKKVEGYFNGLGFEKPHVRSLADFLLSVSDPMISGSVTKADSAKTVPKTTEAFVEAYEASEYYKDVLEHTTGGLVGSAQKHSKAPEVAKKIMSADAVQPFFRQCRILLGRELRITWDRRSIMQEFGSKILLALLVGTLFFRLPLNSDGAFTRTGVLFMTCIIYALSAVQGIGNKFRALPIYLKQRESQLFDAAPYQLAGVLDSFILTLLTSFVFSTILYMMCGLNLQNSGIHYAYFFFVCFTLGTTMDMVARVATVIFKSSEVAISVVSIASIAFIIYSGYLIDIPSSPPWFVWIAWISPIQYAFRALAYNEFGGLVFSCDDDELLPPNPAIPIENRQCPVTTGELYIEANFGFPPDVMLILWGLSLVLFIITISLGKRLKYRGKTMLVNVTDKLALGVDVRSEDTHVGIKAAHFTWSHVNYTVPIGKGENKELLHDVSGFALPGRLCALMGSSGAGKTTLMDVLARRKTKGTIDGTVMINGYPQDDLFGRVSGYVEQMDIHISKTTVREAIEFSAKLRLPPEVSAEERAGIIERTIDLLELREVQNDLVGKAGAAVGLSSEQRKRLTIAVELVVRPSILFLDEPTSGLDSRAALKVANALRRVSDTGVAVLCTIHQPSREVFSCFDSLLLLQRGGKVVYFGDLGEDSKQMINYFESKGAEKIGPDENPADYMLAQIGAGVAAREKVDQVDWHEVWCESKECAAVLSEVETNEGDNPEIVPEGAPHIKFEHKYATGIIVQSKANLMRFLKVYWRTPEYNFTRILSALLEALLLGFTFFRLPNDPNGVNLLVGATFMAGLAALTNINNAVGNVIADRIAFYRENAAGAYSPMSYYIPLLMADIPFNFAAQILFSVIFYFLVGYRPESFGYFFVAGLIYALWANATGAMFGAISPTEETGLQLVPLMNSVLNLLAGFTLPRPSIPPWYIWIYWMNPNAYYLVGNLKNVLEGLPVECDSPPTECSAVPESEYGIFTLPDTFSSCEEIPNGVYFTSPCDVDGGIDTCLYCPVASGDQILMQFGVPDYDKWVSVGALVGFTMFSSFIGMLGFQYLRYLTR